MRHFQNTTFSASLTLDLALAGWLASCTDRTEANRASPTILRYCTSDITFPGNEFTRFLFSYRPECCELVKMIYRKLIVIASNVTVEAQSPKSTCLTSSKASKSSKCRVVFLEQPTPLQVSLLQVAGRAFQLLDFLS